MNTNLMFVLSAFLVFSITPQAFAEYEDTIAILETGQGRIIIEFFPNDAPNHVSNFIKLAEDGFYTKTVFHRIIEDFMIQGGDPKTKDMKYALSEWGTGDPGYSIDSEFNNIQHKRGIVSMARSTDPNSAGSQFFIVHKDSFSLDGQYTVFGRILTDESFQTLDKIATIGTVPSNNQPLSPVLVTINDVKIVLRSELSNLTEDAPERTDIKIESPSSQPNVFEEYGISFSSPPGWLVQTPPVTSSTSPQIAIVGPQTSNSMPAISFRMDPTTDSLDVNVQLLKDKIQPLIEAEALTIVGEEAGEIKGYPAYLMKAVGHFQGENKQERNIGFFSILIKNFNVLYTIQYTNNVESFDSQEEYFTTVINSIEFFTPQPMGTNTQDGNMDRIADDLENQQEGGGCLIATAAFGSEIAPQVQFLREIRDDKVMTTQSGTAFMTGFNQFYYSFSPAVADYQRENPVFKEAVKVTLTPLLASLSLLTYVDVDSEEEMLGYGIGIILLNIGMYFVIPASMIIIIKNRIK